MELALSSEKITDLAKTMISVQQSLTPALKDGLNSYTQSSYATLASVMEACRSVLLSHGIWLTQYPISAEAGHLGLVTKIVHAATGQWQSSFIEMPLPKNDPQGYGSAITYARRYGLSALLGIITEDDDGEAAALRESAQPLNGVSRESHQPPEAKGNVRTATPPHLDGVSYRTQKDKEGKELLIAFGNTHSKKEFLKTSGFKWDGQEKFWWRYAHAA